jgi:endonuclease/exonuclease/phosphatase family metal-dependent hydrolase
MGPSVCCGCALVLFLCAGGCGTHETLKKTEPAGRARVVATAVPAAAGAAGAAGAASAVAALVPSPTDLRVMSCNVRVKTLFDLQNHWGLRKKHLVSRIRAFAPDLLGTQECLASQADYLRDQLDGYEFFGAGRNDGKRRGEMCGVFYRADRFEKLDGGHFWLSRDPSKPGSKGWGAWFPRMVTWVKLRPRDGGETFYFFNTHFDAFASRARRESARLLRERMASIAGGAPCVVTGDFNADEGSDAYRTLLAGTGALRGVGAGVGRIAGTLVDTFRAANPTLVDRDGTRHGFWGGRGGPRIDWIIATPHFQAVAGDIDRDSAYGRYPSDHFPVTAVLRPMGTAPVATADSGR